MGEACGRALSTPLGRERARRQRRSASVIGTDQRGGGVDADHPWDSALFPTRRVLRVGSRARAARSGKFLFQDCILDDDSQHTKHAQFQVRCYGVQNACTHAPS